MLSLTDGEVDFTKTYHRTERCRENFDSIADLAEKCRNNVDDDADHMFLLVKNRSRGLRDRNLNDRSAP
jgi:hypothetical protein